MWKHVIVGVALTTSACVGPARDYSGYQGKARASTESAGSAVQTTILVIETAERGLAAGPYLSVTVSDAEGAAATAQSRFASIQPPDAASDRLRTQVLPLLSLAADEVARARIAVRRGDVPALLRLRGPLLDLSRRLDDLSRRLLP